MADGAPVPVPTLATARLRLRPYRDAGVAGMAAPGATVGATP